MPFWARRVAQAAIFWIWRWLTEHAVAVLARNPSKLPPGKYQLTIHLGDATDADAVDDTIFGREIVVSALGLANNTRSDALSTGVANIVAAMRAHKLSRLIVVAGAGILQDRSADRLRMDAPDFNAALLPYAQEHRRIYDLLRDTDLHWTLVCPTYMREEPATGQARVEVDYLPTSAKSVTFQDVARFTYGLAGNLDYDRQRVGIAE